MSANLVKQTLTLKHARGESTWHDGPVRIGRAADNQLVIQDESLSRHHAEIHPTRNGWLIRDLQSANGIWVGGARVPSCRLRKGEVVVLGSVPVTVCEATIGKPANPVVLRAAMIAAIALMGAYLVFDPRPAEPVAASRSPEARVFEARTPPPPENFTAQKAVDAAKRSLAQSDRSGEALADARRALAWSKALNGGRIPSDAASLQTQVEKELSARFQQGSVAYLRAKRLGDKRAAESAMRMLRETFPYDDPRSVQIDRMERSR